MSFGEGESLSAGDFGLRKTMLQALHVGEGDQPVGLVLRQSGLTGFFLGECQIRHGAVEISDYPMTPTQIAERFRFLTDRAKSARPIQGKTKTVNGFVVVFLPHGHIAEVAKSIEL